MADPQQPAKRHAVTALEQQRAKLDRLLKDPAKPAFVPEPPKEKTIRAPREMMKNVQGSSAGAGSGEFHVYKASRRREYERLKMMEDITDKEKADREFELQRLEREAAAEAKTAKNRAKRQKKKNNRAAGSKPSDTGEATGSGNSDGSALKKRRLVNGKELTFKRPGEESGEEDEEEAVDVGPQLVGRSLNQTQSGKDEPAPQPTAVTAPTVTIHEDD